MRTQANGAALPLRNDRVLAVDGRAWRLPAFDLPVNAGTLLAILLPGGTVLVDGAVRPA